MGGHFTRDKVLHRSALTDRTVRLICQAYLADFCCFNFPWPPPCRALLETQEEDSPTKDPGTDVTLRLTCPGREAKPSNSLDAARGGANNADLLDEPYGGSEHFAPAPLWRNDPVSDRPRHPPHLYATEKNVLMLQAHYSSEANEKLASLRSM